VKRARRWGPGLLLVSPSIILIGIFVYGLIGWNVKVSLSNWREAQHTTKWAGLAAYRDLRHDAAWTENVHHILLFTATFIIGALLVGLTLAFLLEKGVRGEGFFRSIYLFPMAISFIAAGVVWRWLMNPAPGDRASGLNVVFDKLGLGFLGHISIKVFDLIVAIGGKQLITQVPAVYMWILIYDARDYAKGAAIATLLLIGISALIIPYLVYTVRSERRA